MRIMSLCRNLYELESRVKMQTCRQMYNKFVEHQEVVARIGAELVVKMALNSGLVAKLKGVSSFSGGYLRDFRMTLGCAWDDLEVS